MRLPDAGVEAECACELVIDIGVPNARRTGPSDDENVAGRSEADMMAAEEFPYQTADAIARRCATDLAAGGDPEARRWLLSLAGNHDEVRNGLPPSLALERQELVSLAQPVLRRKALRAAPARRSQFGCLGGIETVRRLRPLARRRFRTCFPPGVAIRARKPCVRLRRLLLGWYVRFMFFLQDCPPAFAGRPR